MPGLFFYNYQHCNHSSLLRGKTYEGIKNGDLDLFASIHFLLRGKTKNTSFLPEILNASIRFPLAREDQPSKSRNDKSILLQSTSLLRGKTRTLTMLQILYMLQSTSLLRGKTAELPNIKNDSAASIHFPLAREDQARVMCYGRLYRFNPLPSCEGRPWRAGEYSDYAVLQSTSLLRGKTRSCKGDVKK